jgi:hypothetical protein
MKPAATLTVWAVVATSVKMINEDANNRLTITITMID